MKSKYNYNIGIGNNSIWSALYVEDHPKLRYTYYDIRTPFCMHVFIELNFIYKLKVSAAILREQLTRLLLTW